MHSAWAWLLSSTLKQDLNYAPSDCFFTYPFPSADPAASNARLDKVGEALYELRRTVMRERHQGLTETYNQLKNPDVADATLDRLRDLHVEMDRAVLAAYGWDDIRPPRFADPTTDDELREEQMFEDEVIDRLFTLNAERAAEERALGVSSKVGKANEASRRKKKAAMKQLPLVEPLEDES